MRTRGNTFVIQAVRSLFRIPNGGAQTRIRPAPTHDIECVFGNVIAYHLQAVTTDYTSKAQFQNGNTDTSAIAA